MSIFPLARRRTFREHSSALVNASSRIEEGTMFFSFPEDARWNAERQVVEFGVGIGEYEGVARIPRQLFRRLIDGAVTPERCLEAYHLQRTRFELAVERKLRNRQLTDDGNVEITGRDMRSPARAATGNEIAWPQARNL